MAEIYKDDETIFGPVELPLLPPNINDISKDKQKEEKKLYKKKTDLFKKGKNRILEKTKEIRQAFSKAVVSGSRSGSGKLVFEHYDTLVKIWGGSATTQPLPFGASSLSAGGDNNDTCSSSDEDQDDSFGSVIDDTLSKNVAEKRKLIDDDDDGNKNAIPKLIDNKRKHLEKALSTSQRDQLLMKDVKADAEFRQNLVQVMRESNKTFSSSIKEISKSMSDLSKGICSSMELLARSLRPTIVPPQQQHIPQNIYYQQYQQAPRNSRPENGFIQTNSQSQGSGFFTQYLNDDEQV